MRFRSTQRSMTLDEIDLP